jgi:hypothetical protein
VAVSLGGVLFTALLGGLAVAALAWQRGQRRWVRRLLVEIVVICYAGDLTGWRRGLHGSPGDRRPVGMLAHPRTWWIRGFITLQGDRIRDPPPQGPGP